MLISEILNEQITPELQSAMNSIYKMKDINQARQSALDLMFANLTKGQNWEQRRADLRKKIPLANRDQLQLIMWDTLQSNDKSTQLSRGGEVVKGKKGAGYANPGERSNIEPIDSELPRV